MRKLAELSGDEFFDVIYAISPILPMIAEMEVLQAQLFGNINPKIAELRATVTAKTKKLNEAKATPDGDGTSAIKNKTIEQCEKAIAEANEKINTEITGIFARDISKIVPLLVSKQNRGTIFETLSILEQLPVDEIKKYPPPKLISKIKQVISDTDFKSFLSYAEQSE